MVDSPMQHSQTEQLMFNLMTDLAKDLSRLYFFTCQIFKEQTIRLRES